MQVVSGLKAIKELNLSKRTCVTIGNFDGCHLGHVKLLSDTVNKAKKLDLFSVVITFDPHPGIVLKERFIRDQLFNLDQKIQAFKELGIDFTIVIPFDEALERLCHEDFYSTYLRDGLKAQTIVVGENFRFGASRLGDISFLSSKSEGDKKFDLSIHEYVEIDGQRVSSTAIRQAISASNISLAKKMLGRPYIIEGDIGRGLQVGRQLGFPTANMQNVTQLVPKNGVYCGYVLLKDGLSDTDYYITQLPKSARPAVFHIGGRPTFNKTDSLLIEASILDTGDLKVDSLYNQKALYYFDQHLAEEKTFASKKELVKAISSYVDKAKAIYGL